MVERVRGVAMPVAVVQVCGRDATVAQGAVHARDVTRRDDKVEEERLVNSQRHPVDHDPEQRRVLRNNSSSNATALGLTVVVKYSRGSRVTSTSGVECSALVNVSISHLRVAVSKESNGI